MKLSYTVDAAHDGREIRQLASSTLGLSAKLWKHIKWNGTILVNGKAIRNVRLCVKAGDELMLTVSVKNIGRGGADSALAGGVARRASRPAARCTLRGRGLPDRQ